MTDLTILCVTKAIGHAEPFVEELAEHAHTLDARLLLAVDGDPQGWMSELGAELHHVHSQGYIESVLDTLIAACPDDGYVLRVDDDERLSPELVDWLFIREYRTADHWAFPRANLWPDTGHHIVNAPLWPDLQTRLSVKAKAGGRAGVHDGSPHGTGTVAPVVIEHHKFLVRSRIEREALVAHYETLRQGAGEQYVMFSVPEIYEDEIKIAPLAEIAVTA